jgi:predicted nucleotidyltransferase
MFIFNASNITNKKDFAFFVEKKMAFFKQKKDELFEEYSILKNNHWDDDVEKYEKFRSEYSEIIYGILTDVIEHYRRFLPEKCLIAEFGSFAKRTERIFSDFDFTICYDEPKTEQYEVAEELIDYSLASIFGISIDHIHGKFQHYPDMPEVHVYSEKDNHYRLVFKDGDIDYKCGPETLNENLMHIKNVRDYQSMIAGYEEKYIYKCNIDCLYSIRILENTTEHDFLGDLTLLEQRYDICDGYMFDLSPYELKQTFQISEIKQVLKAKGVVEFYIFIAVLRKKIGFCSIYSMSMSDLWVNKIMLSFFGSEYVGKLKKAFVEFVFYFNRIELSLNKRGIPLSTRCYTSFTMMSINELLSEDWGGTTDIEIIIGARNGLASIVQEGLCLLQERA